jgi:exodeoxyribonuclease V alpha subunit
MGRGDSTKAGLAEATLEKPEEKKESEVLRKVFTIVKIFYPKEAQDGLRWNSDREGELELEYTIALAYDEENRGQTECLKGAFGPVSEGELIAVGGNWKEDYSQYAKRFNNRFFKVAYLEMVEPVTRDAVTYYLRKMPGIGEAFAEAIVEQLGGAKVGNMFDGRELLRKIDENPGILAQVRNAAGRRFPIDYPALIDKWNDLRDSQETLLFLGSLGIGEATAKDIQKAWGKDCVKIIKENPYNLCLIEGINFRMADRLATTLGVEADDPRRLEWGVDYVLSRAEDDGHVCMTREQFFDRAPYLLRRRNTKVALPLIEAALERMFEAERIIVEDEIDSEGRVISERLYSAELYLIENRIHRLLNEKLTREPFTLPENWKDDPDNGLSDEQNAGIRMVFEEPLSILTGGPGAGKTTSLKGLIDKLEEHSLKYVCLAPTGRAAKRMAESTTRPASTVHRALGYDGLAPPRNFEDDPLEPKLGAKEYKINGRDPVTGKNTYESVGAIDVVVVDESSMLDMRLAERILSHLGPDTRIVFVGDPDQLPPVKAGAVLHDMLKSGRVPTTRLTKIFRQEAAKDGNGKSSLILENAYRVKEGQPIFWSAKEAEEALGYGVEEDWVFIEANNDQQMVHAAVQAFDRIQEELKVTSEDIMVTAPTHKGDAGVSSLNGVFQKKLNPNGEVLYSSEHITLKKDDRVMNLENRYSKFYSNRPGEAHDVFNGDVGRITGSDGKGGLFVDYGEGPQSYHKGEVLTQLTLANAATTHKLQGSEAKGIVSVASGPQGYSERMLNRYLLYTAWTRPSHRCYVVGSKQVISEAIKRDIKRETLLDLKVGSIEPRLANAQDKLRALRESYDDYAQVEGITLRTSFDEIYGADPTSSNVS